MADSKLFPGMAVICSIMSVGFAFNGKMKESTAFSVVSLIFALATIVT